MGNYDLGLGTFRYYSVSPFIDVVPIIIDLQKDEFDMSIFTLFLRTCGFRNVLFSGPSMSHLSIIFGQHY